MAGLEEVGIPGQEYLREALTNCSDPLKAIEEFQVENGILLPSLRTMLPLLDLHGIKRLEFHTSILEELKEHLLRQIEELGKQEGREKEKKLKELLQKSFPVIKVPSLRPVVLCILQNMDRVEEKYLKHLVTNKELYQECGIQVKRQIWQDNQSLFGDEVYPLFLQYVKEKEDLLFNFRECSYQFFAPSPKQRRQGEIIQKLATIVGRNVKLYDTMLQFLRSLFHRTKNIHYCTLRSELLMALHDLEVQEITSVDPCHKFTWCLDACIREKHVEAKRARELQAFLESSKHGQIEVLGDIAMTLADPYATNFLATSTFKILNHLIASESQPRDNQVLVLLARLMNLGLNAWEIMSSVIKEPRIEPELITKFMPSLMCVMVDDQVRSLNTKLPPDDRETAITTIEHSGPPPDSFVNYIQVSGVASMLAMYQVLHAARQKDRQGLMRILGALSNSHKDRAFEDTFLHTLVGHLIPMADEFSTEDFCTVVFDEFFFGGLHENALCHLIKLLFHIFPKLPPSRLELVIQTIQPIAEHGGTVIKESFAALEEAIQSYQPPSSRQSMDVDSPLLSVPTPAPFRQPPHF